MNAWFGVVTSEPKEEGKDASGEEATGEDLEAPPAAWSLSSRSTTASSAWSWDSLFSPESLAPACKPPVQIPVETTNMKVIHLAIVKNATRPAVDLCAESDLTNYSRFMRGSYAEMIGLGAATIAERTKPGQRQDIENENLNATVHAYGRSEGICGIMITDPEYPSIVAHQVLSKIVDEFLNKNPVSNWIDSNAKVPFPELKEYLVKYQNPEEADSIMKIQKELDETKIVLHKTIETVLQRGETMEKLAADSTRLSFQTKAFAQQAKKTNSCCILM